MRLTEEQKQFLKRNHLTLKQIGDFFGIVNINKSRKSKAKYINALMAFENHIKMKKEELTEVQKQFLEAVKNKEAGAKYDFEKDEYIPPSD